jgi:hypothetical protein
LEEKVLPHVPVMDTRGQHEQGIYPLERFRYDAEQNYYNRLNGGTEHVDEQTGNQIHVKNVIVQFVPTGVLEATSGRLTMETIGTGRAVVFRDGVAIEGEWHTEAHGERTRFTTATGEEISLVPGNIWIEVLPDGRSLEYSQ